MRYLLTQIIVAIALLASGCAGVLGPAPHCPPGSMPTRVSADRTVDASGEVKADIPNRTGTVGGAWKGSGSTEYTCTRLCPPGTAPQIAEKTVRCTVISGYEFRRCPTKPAP